MIRLYLENFDQLRSDQMHYLITVMRRKEGDLVALFNDKQGEWIAEISKIDKKQCTLKLLRQSKKPGTANKLGLIFSPAKNNYSLVIQKATELGVSDIIPIITERSVVKDFNFERMYKIAIEAAEQSERITIPQIHEFKKLYAVDFSNFKHIFFCDETRDCKAMPTVLHKFKDNNAAITIGAEGGFSPSELEFMKQLKNCHPVKLSDNILKADTAAIAALSIYQAVHCD